MNVTFWRYDNHKDGKCLLSRAVSLSRDQENPLGRNQTRTAADKIEIRD